MRLFLYNDEDDLKKKKSKQKRKAGTQIYKKAMMGMWHPTRSRRSI